MHSYAIPKKWDCSHGKDIFVYDAPKGGMQASRTSICTLNLAENILLKGKTGRAESVENRI
jgi:hypothetical protein